MVMDRDWSGEMQSRVASLIAGDPGFDVIHADQLAMAPYAVAARKDYETADTPAIVLDQHNAVFNVVRRLADHEDRVLWRRLLTWEAGKLARYEASICADFDHIVWVADHDRAALAGLPPQAGGPEREGASSPREVPSTVIPISVDPTVEAPVPRSREGRRVIFLGGLNWPPNERGILHFIERAWPGIRKAAPDACLTIIGRNPPRWLINWSRNRPDLDVPGYVLDLTPYLRDAAVFVVPLDAGGGMRVKILSAWCWGVPVVSTSIGAEGLRAHHGENLIIADTADMLSSCVIELLQNPAHGEQLVKAGRETVEKNYNWRDTYSAWDNVYAQLARRAGQIR
jgi:glycosyltransferase involved in cell wall biosynthesis